MAASVRIEDEAFVDTRIELLGALAGYNRFEALGRMAHLWRICTQRESYVLDEVWVAACLGETGPDLIVKAGLAERVEGGLRIRGTEGRIEWLKVRREASKRGGEATRANSQKAAKTGPKAGQAGAKRGPNRGQKQAAGGPDEGQTGAKPGPKAGPPTASPGLPTEDEDKPPSGACVPPAPALPPSPATPRKTPDTPHHRCIAYFTSSWQAAYGVKFAFDGGKDATAVKEALESVEQDEDRFRGAVDRFFADREEFVTKTRHALGLFRSQLPRWLADALPPVRAPTRRLDAGAAREAYVLGAIDDALNAD